MILVLSCLNYVFIATAHDTFSSFDSLGPAKSAYAVSDGPSSPACHGSARRGTRGMSPFDCGDGKMTAAIRDTESYVVHGLDADPVKVAEARPSSR